MNRSATRWVSGCFALVLGWACAGDSGETSSACTLGTEKCGCDANRCNRSLRCLSNVCVRSAEPAFAGSAGAAGSEIDPAAGGEDSVGGAPSSSGGRPNGGNVARGGADAGGGSSTGGKSVNGGSGDTSGGDSGVSGGAGAAGGAPSGSSEAGAGGASTAGGAGGALDNDGGEPAGGSAPASGGSAQGGEAGSSGSVLFSDDFEDGDASGWSAASWRVFADGDNQVMRQNAAYSGTTTSAIAGDEGWGDRRMEVSFKFSEQAGVSYAIFGTEFESADNRDQIMIDRAGSGTLLHASGGQTTTDTFDASVSPGTWYRLALEIDGTTLRGYFDGALVAQLENVSGVQGGVALSGNQNGDVSYDDVLVTTLP